MQLKRSLLNIMLVSPFLTVCVSQANDEPVTPPLVFGNTYITAGESAKIQGDIKAMTYFVAGANAQFGKVANGNAQAVSSDIQTGTAVTTGAGSFVAGNIRAGSAITLGAATIVGTDSEDGAACAGTALTLGAAVTYNAGFSCDASSPKVMTYSQTDLIIAKEGYSHLTPVDTYSRNVLESMISKHTELDPEDMQAMATSDTGVVPVHSDNNLETYVYNATSLTTGAGINLILKGDFNWVFNIDNMLSLGAGSEIIMDAGSTGSVTWNVGGYSSLGEASKLVGTVLSNGYVSTGADAEVTAAPGISGGYCGGLFSADSYVTIGAGGTVEGCGEVTDI